MTISTPGTRSAQEARKAYDRVITVMAGDISEELDEDLTYIRDCLARVIEANTGRDPRDYD